MLGGNASLLISLIGTDYEPDFEGKLVFIEEIAEYPYKVDRMFTQLLMATNIAKAAGIILGIFRGCDIDGVDTKSSDSFSLEEVLRDRLQKLNMPVMYGFPFGHVKNKAILPTGINARMDADNISIELLETAVN